MKLVNICLLFFLPLLFDSLFANYVYFAPVNLRDGEGNEFKAYITGDEFKRVYHDGYSNEIYRSTKDDNFYYRATGCRFLGIKKSSEDSIELDTFVYDDISFTVLECDISVSPAILNLDEAYKNIPFVIKPDTFCYDISFIFEDSIELDTVCDESKIINKSFISNFNNNIYALGKDGNVLPQLLKEDIKGEKNFFIDHKIILGEDLEFILVLRDSILQKTINKVEFFTNPNTKIGEGIFKSNGLINRYKVNFDTKALTIGTYYLYAQITYKTQKVETSPKIYFKLSK